MCLCFGLQGLRFLFLPLQDVVELYRPSLRLLLWFLANGPAFEIPEG